MALFVSGCTRLHEVWNSPAPWTGPDDKIHLPSASPSVSQQMGEIWNTPLFEFSEPFGGYDGCDTGDCDSDSIVSKRGGRLLRDAYDVWNTPVYTLQQPFSQTVSDVWNRPFFWNTQPPPEYVDPTPYRHWANAIDYPDVESPPPPPAEMFMAEPRRLRNLQKDEIWDMPLEQAIQIALSNSHIIRSSGQFLNPGNPLLNSPDFVPSSLDPAIQESGVLFGQRGVEAALSEFDTQFTTTMIWGRDEQIQNSSFGTGIPPGQELVQETGVFSSRLTKRLVTGGVIGVIHDWNYLGSNTNDFFPGTRLFPSSYTGRFRVEARQPLWAGAGTEYARIAGPLNEQIQGVTGVQQGVLIARINNDIEIAEFEGAIHNLLRDVETLYWQLYLAYQTYGSEMALLSEAVASYGDVETLIAAESPLAGALEESDAIEFVYQMQARVNQARDNLYDVEAQLRRIIGLMVTDGKVIRPLDEPTLAEYLPDWHITLSEALARRVELRKQKWNVKQLELQLKAARKLVMPRLDVVASYQVNGFGDDLLGNVRDGVTASGLGSAGATVTRGDQTGWNLGVEFSMPLGLRFARTQVRSHELKLAKAHVALAEAEIEVSHELADTFRELDRTYLAMTIALNRKRTAARRLKVVEALHRREPERYNQDAILRSRDQLNQVEQAYLQALVGYNVALMELHYRGGKLLEINNVHLSEGSWDAEAEFEVAERMHDRQRSIPTASMLHHEPAPFVSPSGAAPIGQPIEHYGPAVQGWEPEPASGRVQGPPPGWILNDPSTYDPPPAPPAEEPAPFPPQSNGQFRRTGFQPVREFDSSMTHELETRSATKIGSVTETPDEETAVKTVPVETDKPAADTPAMTPKLLRSQLRRASAEARGYIVPPIR